MKRAFLLIVFLQTIMVLKSQDSLSVNDRPSKITSISDSSIFKQSAGNNEQKLIQTPDSKSRNTSESYNKSETANVNRDSLAKVYFFRPPFTSGSAISMKLFVDNQPIVRLRCNSYYGVELKPGIHKFSSAVGHTAVLTLKIEARKTYYIASYFVTGFWSGLPVLELASDKNGKSLVEGGYLRPQIYEPIIEKKLNSRIGLVFGGGGGFQSINMGKTSDNADLTLSPGGGGLIGVEYGHEYGKRFDMSLSIFYEGSTLSPSIKNGNAGFDRLAFLVTPALIIPVKGDYMKFRIGGGVGLYSFGSLSIGGDWVNNHDVRMNYLPALGYHASIVFDVLMSEKASYTLGLRYYNVNYIYTENGSNAKPLDNTFNNLNGSGIDFTMGFNFHFAK